jgi:diguanylate cyclase (GGDEF)-like protein
MNDELFLLDDDDDIKEVNSAKWNILIVDDEVAVHTITIAALKNKYFEGQKINFISAFSALEAKKIVQQENDIALALVDVVMETPEAGLDLINYIRNELKNEMIRLVLRTGQPSQAPESDIIEQYDINDYKEKTELTVQKLYTLVRTSLRQYAQFKELRSSHDAMYQQMTTSELTGLPNRIKLNQILDSKGDKSLILVNIDNFSTINETQGFDVGNQLLKAFAGYIERAYLDKMKLYHIHADIFALLCFNVDDKSLIDCVENLKSDISNRHFKLQSIEIQVTVSIGLAIHESGNLIQKAELAIKEARNIGKNHTQVYNQDLNIIRTIHANSLWTGRIRNAIKENKVLAYFQAIKNYKTDKIEKYEALVRIEFEGEIIGPYQFLDAALYSGQIYSIFKIMFKKVCQKAQTTRYNFSVNMTDADMNEPDFFNFVKQTIKEYDIAPHRIALEVLEYTSIAGKQNIKLLLNALHDYGFKISIDDFGAGCSNFSQLNNIHIDYIKIDGSFIKDIVENKNSQIVSRTIIDYAHQKNIPVIAEFICNRDVYDYVKTINADYAQGYYVSEPSPELQE